MTKKQKDKLRQPIFVGASQNAVRFFSLSNVFSTDKYLFQDDTPSAEAMLDLKRKEVKELKAKLEELLEKFKVVQHKSRDRKRQLAELVSSRNKANVSAPIPADVQSLQSRVAEQDMQLQKLQKQLADAQKESTLEDQAGESQPAAGDGDVEHFN